VGGGLERIAEIAHRLTAPAITLTMAAGRPACDAMRRKLVLLPTRPRVPRVAAPFVTGSMFHC
jgi:hypothetical protein